MAYTQSNINKRGLYFNKDKKAKIYHTSTIKDKYHNSITVFRPIAPTLLWCYTRQLTQEQIFGAAAYFDEETRVFVFNYRTEIKISDYVLYKGEWYEITRVDMPEDYTTGTDMFIYVKNSKTKISDDKVMEYEE